MSPAEKSVAEFFAQHRPASLLQRMIEPQEIAGLVALRTNRCSPSGRARGLFAPLLGEQGGFDRVIVVTS